MPGLASNILPVHILAGGLALVFGYTALYAVKGESLHRRSGLLFAGAMMVMSLTGAFIAAVHVSPVSVIAGLLTFYFVATSLLTVRRRAPGALDKGAMVLALATTLFGVQTAFELIGHGSPEAAPMVMFIILGLLAASGDARMIRAGGIHGARRIARHLWRMCFAMWVAAASFFLGARGRVPEVIDLPLLKAVGVLAPIVVMLYWLWRLRRKSHVTLPSLAPQEMH